MWAKAFTLTLRVPQGDPTLNIGNKINLPNTYGGDTNNGVKFLHYRLELQFLLRST